MINVNASRLKLKPGRSRVDPHSGIIRQELGDQWGERSGSGLWILDSGLEMRRGKVGFSAESTLKTDSGPSFKGPVEPSVCMSEH